MRDGNLVTLSREDGGSGVDLITEEQFENFELSIEFKLTAVGNSGILYRVVEREGEAIWYNAPEYQVLDDSAHIAMGTMDMHKHLTGDNYDIQASSVRASNPIGEWNHARIIVNGQHVEHWLNGVMTVEYEIEIEGRPPVRAVALRQAKDRTLAVGEAVGLALRDPDACVVLEARAP